MITEILQRQIGKELEFIYSEGVTESFLQYFFASVLAEEDISEYDSIQLFIAMAYEYVYVNMNWLSDDGIQEIREFKIPYDAYNNWARSVNDR